MLKIHPLAELFPLMEGKAFDDFCADIKTHGQIEPIVIHEGVILDGRNRARACDRLGKPVRQMQFCDLNLKITPEEYIWSKNFERRHLTEDQKSSIAMQYREKCSEDGKAAMAEGGKKAAPGHPEKGMKKSSDLSPKPTTTRAKLAKLAGVSEYKIQQAEIVTKAAPELLPRVAAGTLKLKDAVNIAEEKIGKTPEQRIAKFNVDKEALKIAALIKEKILDAPEQFRSEIIQILKSYLPTSVKGWSAE